ncbi:MAG: metallophosphoesterase [Chitinophagaceae bacterium]|nr:MAG: metallophosphoesterase [Chitinophagaceae bacterium]
MNRRQFLQQFSLLTGGLILAGQTPLSALAGADKKIKGRITAKGKGLAGVVVSDGYTVIATDKKGRFELEPHTEAVSLFISTPAGYEFIQEKNIARHYKLINEVNSKKELKFELKPLAINDNEHQFFIWADPQVKNAKDVEKMMTQTVPDVKKMIAAAGAGTLIHGITVGDIVWDELKLFDDYSVAVDKMGIPFFQCLGNHDMDYRKGGDETSDDTFQQTFGPTHYSFNRGKIHYVVMDNVRYLGKDRDYDGFFQQNQLDWLQKDLSFVPADKLIVLCVHIPVHKHTKNSDALYALLQGRNVHIMSGHTHYHQNIVKDNIFEHNHGTVCGAWWTGNICEDGTPNGYGVYKVKGTELSWHYQATGRNSDYQMETYLSDIDADSKLLQVNIWNFDPQWKTAYFVDGVSKGPLTQFEGMDPVAYKNMLGPNLPKPRGFAEPKITNHLFKAAVPSSAKEIRVEATDRFGKTFTAIQKMIS